MLLFLGTVQNLGLIRSKVGTNFRTIFEMTGTKSVVNLEKLKYLMVLGGRMENDDRGRNERD